MTGMPASIILLTGAVSVPMPNAWMATKSHFCEAMLSIAERCLTASSWPSNQVTSTLNSLPQYSAACLPCAHQVACRPALEKAAFSGFEERPGFLGDGRGHHRIEPDAAEQRAGAERGAFHHVAPRMTAGIPLGSSIVAFLPIARVRAP